MKFGSNGFINPECVAVDSSNQNIIVSETWNRRIQVFNEYASMTSNWTSYTTSVSAIITFIAKFQD